MQDLVYDFQNLASVAERLSCVCFVLIAFSFMVLSCGTFFVVQTIVLRQHMLSVTMFFGFGRRDCYIL